MKKMKKTVSIKVDEKLWDMFQLTVAATKDVNYSDVIDGLLRDYIITHKVDVNEALRNFWEVKK